MADYAFGSIRPTSYELADFFRRVIVVHADARAAEPGPQQNDHTMPLLRRPRSITHAQKNHDAVRLIRPTGYGLMGRQIDGGESSSAGR